MVLVLLVALSVGVDSILIQAGVSLSGASKGDCNEEDKGRVIETKCMELISAMAAGKGAKQILEITTQGITPLTMALAVAAKQTSGQLICILPSLQSSHHIYYRQQHHSKIKLRTADLQRFIKSVHAAGSNPCEITKQIAHLQLKKVDFVVVDCRFDDGYLELMFKTLDVGDVIKTGSMVIVHNVDDGKDGLGHVFRKMRVESVTLPIGERTEITRVLGLVLGDEINFSSPSQLVYI
ncbi:hypothetical protein F3Y22_tig00112000pilonHSYRG00286 [Hibiscus syriacus]|uniref:Uncharacterized protein n=1 Tax=Hibiscus syriacus TaxID=106335 RepID=A0A6A2X735_HIBSY|nr:hypothetical protein F3Y22_tig00112000pilonHSYRG00286 [Hibiscus syriacus]